MILYQLIISVIQQFQSPNTEKSLEASRALPGSPIYIRIPWSCLARPEKLIGNEYRVECDCQLGKCFSEATCMDIRTYSRRSSALPIRNTRVPVCLSHLGLK